MQSPLRWAWERQRPRSNISVGWISAKLLDEDALNYLRRAQVITTSRFGYDQEARDFSISAAIMNSDGFLHNIHVHASMFAQENAGGQDHNEERGSHRGR